MKISKYSGKGLTTGGWLLIILGIIIIVGILFFLFSLLIPLFFPPSPNIEIPEEQLSGEVTVEDITNNPQNYYGTQVVVDGQVRNLVGDNGFLLSEPGVVGLDLLVVSNTNVRELFSQENVPGDEKVNVEILGDVQQFNITDVENKAGVNLDNNLFQPYEGKPVIIANQIVILIRSTP